MEEIALVRGQDALNSLAWYCRQIADDIESGDCYEVRAWVDPLDGGALKLRVNNRTWTPPLGRLEKR
jgi:hypothetical protein